ncbi:hypothetical protein [Brevundimonas sp. PAMC22021]|uniref:hypothetical protein n=1 Tax=Brevundimonas sp. PAMC22021 TaxID=2861285 RepID=UPI001C63352C|nr:hypothetical protein [Brevundimonas sp. PAMC22021]QYF87412.1 hypothetical protein KY493_02590 [Brevundimonas sp. PAMC22021]
MRRTPSIAVVTTLALLALGACATPTMRAPEAGAPAPTPGLDWFDHRDGGDLSLAYGRETSDDLRLRLDCRAGSGTLMLTAPAHGAEPFIHLESGGDTERFTAKVEPSGLGDGDLVIASDVSQRQPVFQRFRSLGWIAAWHGETREVYAPQPGSAVAVSRFMDACEAG